MSAKESDGKRINQGGVLNEEDSIELAASRARELDESEVSKMFDSLLKEKEGKPSGLGDPSPDPAESPVAETSSTSVLAPKVSVIKTKFPFVARVIAFVRRAVIITALLAAAIGVGFGVKWLSGTPAWPVITDFFKSLTSSTPDVSIKAPEPAPVQADAPVQASTPANTQTQAPADTTTGSGAPAGPAAIEPAPTLDDIQGFEIVIDDLTEEEKIARIVEIRRLTEGWPASKRQCDALPKGFSQSFCERTGEEAYFKCAPTGVVWRLSIDGCDDITGILAAEEARIDARAKAKRKAEDAEEKAIREAKLAAEEARRKAKQEAREAERKAEEAKKQRDSARKPT